MYFDRQVRTFTIVYFGRQVRTFTIVYFVKIMFENSYVNILIKYLVKKVRLYSTYAYKLHMLHLTICPHR